MDEHTGKWGRGLVAIALVAAACGRTTAGPPIPADGCIVAPVAGPGRDSVRVLLADAARSGVLVRQDAGPAADCAGRIHGTGAITLPTVLIDSMPNGDVRDQLEAARIDLVVTRDPAVLDYARRTRLRVVPLPWDRVYVLEAGGATLPDSLERAGLARDAVRGDSRGAEPPFWWRDDPTCVDGSSVPAAIDDVAYPARDPVAQALAARVVALDAMEPRPAWLWRRAQSGRPGRAVGRDAGSAGTGPRIVGYPARRPADGCAGRWSRAALPLIETRASLVVGPEVPSFEILADGSIRFLGSSVR